uniref:Uncharacterized protein n=1 Tax=Acartia pacifica TaxID=335913 RepID=R9TEZ0_ACAPC|nr:hypothetical protein [Acartia pacifica]
MTGGKVLLVVCLFVVGVVNCQEDNKLDEEDLKLLRSESTIPLEEALRCGIFFAQDQIGLDPIERLFVIKFTWPAPECPTEDRVERGVEHCSKLWDKIVTKLQYKKPSLVKERKEAGFSMGDDICNTLKEKGVLYAGNKSKRFPEGMTLGFFSNTCANVKWEDTGKRHPEKICCAKGTHVDCP